MSKRDKEIINLISNKIMEEWKIGEIRQVNGEWYQCILAIGGVQGMFLSHTELLHTSS